MNWVKFTPYKNAPKDPLGHDLGQIANVYLNEDKTLIKRTYNHIGVTVNNNPSEYSKDFIYDKWCREYKWLNEFNGMFFMPELIDINFEEAWTIQRYYGPDLLTQGINTIPDIEDQVLKIYKFFKDRNVYKKNGSLSNMTHDNGRLITFDYKWMVERDEIHFSGNIDHHKNWEITSFELWLSKINPDLVPKLKALL